MKILPVEDEPGLISVIVRGLTEAGMEVSVAAGGNTGLEMALGHNFDLIILDIMLPGMNGIQVCKELRKTKQHIAILMLTALSSTENIVTGLNSGADDYLGKPFKFAELEARIRTLVRRSASGGHVASKSIVINDLEVNTISDLLSLSKRNREYELISDEFYQRCDQLKKEHPEIKNLKIEFLYGSTLNLFCNFLEANEVSHILDVSDHAVNKLNKSSIDPSILIKRSGLPVIAVGTDAESGQVTESKMVLEMSEI
ncbi:response regulator transcription factor [Arcticibacter eurypsychrophilus]|uniref:response regulator transcription factor n=1 Tax=Arcticibacter eurypsychrophilus TaxID=1434752 RepID=UPI0009F6F74A|nr:response regulator transcription factor [Arcticibacter eurypsychrophilus]